MTPHGFKHRGEPAEQLRLIEAGERADAADKAAYDASWANRECRHPDCPPQFRLHDPLSACPWCGFDPLHPVRGAPTLDDDAYDAALANGECPDHDTIMARHRAGQENDEA